MAQIGRREIQIAVDRGATACDDQIGRLALQQAFWPIGRIAEGASRAGDLVDPRLQRGGDRKIVDGTPITI